MLTTLKAKLRALFLAMIVLFAAGGGFGMWRISVLSQSTTEVATVWLPRAKAAETLGTLVSTYRIREARHVLSPAEEKAAADNLVAAADAEMARGIAAYRKRLNPGEDTRLLADFERTWNAYKAGDAAMLAASRAGDADQAARLFRDGKARYDAMVAAAQAISAHDSALATAFATKSYGLIILSMIVATAVAMVCAFLLGVYFERRVALVLARMTELMSRLATGDFQLSVMGQERRDEIGDMARALEVFRENGLQNERLEAAAKVQAQEIEAERQKNEAERAEAARAQKLVVDQLASGLARLSEGDLTIRLRQAFAGDYEKLRDDFNRAIGSLEESVGRAVASATVISGGVGQISSAADDLARRTEQQAATIEETAAALDQITATVRKTTAGVADANRAVAEVDADTQRSSDIVHRAISGMSEIENSAQQISEIIGVIDEIAFQTNLLALNAGVEAARAGEAGKGFAVVAAEVRALAQRSAEAAKQIKALITASSEQVGHGVQLVGETGAALERIAAQITSVNQLMSQMAISASEQTTGIEQVNIAVNQMDQVTQQNAAMVEQSTAATRALADEGRGLAEAMARFRVRDEGEAIQARAA